MYQTWKRINELLGNAKKKEDQGGLSLTGEGLWI